MKKPNDSKNEEPSPEKIITGIKRPLHSSRLNVCFESEKKLTFKMKHVGSHYIFNG